MKTQVYFGNRPRGNRLEKFDRQLSPKEKEKLIQDGAVSFVEEIGTVHHGAMYAHPMDTKLSVWEKYPEPREIITFLEGHKWTEIFRQSGCMTSDEVLSPEEFDKLLEKYGFKEPT
jgi:hypothetical protein